MKLARLPATGTTMPTEAAARAHLEEEGFGCFVWTDPPGARYAPHHHDHDECIWVVAGRMTFTAGGETLTLDAGDRLLLPRSTVHTALAGPAGATYVIGERSSA